MNRSTDRILTTHTGSLPRPADLVSMEEGHDQRDLQHDARFEQQVKAAVREIVREQVDAHVDVVNDGEASKVSYATYVTERLTGFEGESLANPSSGRCRRVSRVLSRTRHESQRPPAASVHGPDHLARRRVGPARHRQFAECAAGCYPAGRLHDRGVARGRVEFSGE